MAWVVLTKECEDAEKTPAAAGVDDIVCSGQQLIQHVGRGPRRPILPHHGEIIRHLPVQQRQLSQLVASQPARTGALTIGRQCCEPVPVRTALLNPMVRDHEIR